MSIFREEILDHYKHPRNFGELPDAAIRVEEYNMPCGDHMAIALKAEDGKLAEIMFSGSGCSLSIAVTSMLSVEVRGKSFAQIEKLNERDILHYVGGSVTAGRLNCVLLGWKTLKKAIVGANLPRRSSGKAGARSPVQGAAPNAFVARDMNLGEIAARWPAARAVLLDYGLHCVGCFASSFDTIEAGAKVHGMSEEEIEEMVGEINKAIVAQGISAAQSS